MIACHGDRLIAPNGRWFDANSLEQIERVFGMARLWRQDYAKKQPKPAAKVLAFPDLGSIRSFLDRVSRQARFTLNLADGEMFAEIHPPDLYIHDHGNRPYLLLFKKQAAYSDYLVRI